MIASADELQMSFPRRADHTGQVPGVDLPQKECYRSLHSEIFSKQMLHLESS